PPGGAGLGRPCSRRCPPPRAPAASSWTRTTPSAAPWRSNRRTDRAGSTPASICWRARESRRFPPRVRSRSSATCSRAGSGGGCSATAAAPASLILEPRNRMLTRPACSRRTIGDPGRDHQPYALPHQFLRRGHGLPGLVPTAGRRRAGQLDRQVLLSHLPAPSSLLRAPHPGGLLEDRGLPRDRRDQAPGGARDPPLPALRARRRDPPRRRPAGAQRNRLELVVLRGAAARAICADGPHAEQAPARAR